MLTQPISDARSWTAASLNGSGYWYHVLDGAVAKGIDRIARGLRDDPRPLTGIMLDGSVNHLREALFPARTALERGRGFVIIRGTPADGASPRELQTNYWLVGQLLGRPCAQNVQGTLLYDVRDTGQDLSQGARFSVTNYESSFHTDNSFGEELVDYIGLLCIQSAKAGGLSQLVSGYTVHNRLLAEHADVLPILYEPFHVDRRGGIRPGEEPTTRKPVLAWDGQGLVYRYLRYWIESGHEKADCPLTAGQVRALSTLDQVARSPGLAVEFMLRPGDMLFVNNRWILHNRTGFEDHREAQRRRHYMRLWLRCL